MRRIGSKHLEEKRRRRNQIIVGLILIFVMFFSVLGFGFQGGHSGGVDPATNPNKGNSNERINYNGFEFTEQNGFWILNKDNTNFIFRFNPNQVEKIDSELKPLANYESKPLYFNSENVLAESEIRTNLAQFVEKMQSACLEEECDESSQIRTCENNFTSSTF